MAPSPPAAMQRLTTPREGDLGLTRISSRTGLQITVLPNAAVFAIEHVHEGRRILINQSFGSPLAGSIGGICLRTGGAQPMILPLVSAQAPSRIGAWDDCIIWQGEAAGVSYEVSVQLAADRPLWQWRVEVSNRRRDTLPCDAVLIQDLGLGEAGFLMNNEAYASQYLDHHVARHPSMGPVLMGRQNLAQSGRHPWVAHGCLEGAVGFATDLLQILGSAHRDADFFGMQFGTALPSIRLQHESACAALQSVDVALPAGATTSWTFFGLYSADHPHASSDADLEQIADAAKIPVGSKRQGVRLLAARRSWLQERSCAIAESLDERTMQRRYPQQMHVEAAEGRLLSFFTPGQPFSRHIVLRDKERRVLRRHGALLVSGAHMLPDDATLCVTCWMHGVFGAQLTLGNTSFHRLLSVSRDPYNITRGSGMRMLVDVGNGWQLLTVPSVFEMGPEECRWIYRLGPRTLTMTAVVSGVEPALQWRAVVEGEPCRLLVFCHLVLGEQEFAHAAPVDVDAQRKRFTFRPEPGGMWSQHYPQALYHLVTSTPEVVEALGGDELLYTDRTRRSGAYATLQTSPTNELAFAVVGSLTDPLSAESLADRYAAGVEDATLRAAAVDHWGRVTRGIRLAVDEPDSGAAAIDTALPWLAHDAMVHLTVPHGLEQYSAGAWGTRDVCQGPVELLLSLEHDEPVKRILRTVFAQQYAERGDWPQWFMLEPYSSIQDMHSHGDVIIWPLKALCDYVEATGDFSLLDEQVPWRREDNLERSTAADSITVHVEKIIATVRRSFVPGTHLLRYGNGDWNDSLQPVDPAKRDWMVSSWTVALLYEQLCRYAEILRRRGRGAGSAEQELAAAIRADFNRLLLRDGTVAGYAVFSPEGGPPELLFHPHDQRTGISCALLPITQGILGGLFTPEQTRHHLELVRKHLSFPDGVRLMDRPIAYHGGPQTMFQRAESAAFFGREIGLMYTHAHLRQAQAMAVSAHAEELWDALLLANPIAVTERLAHASLRQRNAYFSSSDAAFRDRYQASAEWTRVSDRTVAVDGGWRIYSSGPGVYVNVLIRCALGVRRRFGARVIEPCLPPALRGLKLQWTGAPPPGSPPP